MPGELKNLVALAISSGSSKYHHQQQQQHQRRQQEKKNVLVEGVVVAERGGGGGGGGGSRRNALDKKHSTLTRRSKDESSAGCGGSGGAKRFSKLLSKSTGVGSSTAPFTPPTDPVDKKAPVASPESDGSSLLNGGSCPSTGPYDSGREHSSYSENYPLLPGEEICEDSSTPKLRSTNRCASLNRDSDELCSSMNGTTKNANGGGPADEASESDSRSIPFTRCQCPTGSSARDAETDDETALGADRNANKIIDSSDALPPNSALSDSTNGNETSERARGWYTTRKSYRSVAYKTWTVGAARKLLNSSRSDYDLQPSDAASGSFTARSSNRPETGKITDGSISDGEEKFYNCTYTRSQDDDLGQSVCFSAASAPQSADASLATPNAVSPMMDVSKLKARKCASSDAVTIFTTTRPINDSITFLSPVDSVPSTSSDKTTSANQPSSGKDQQHTDKMENTDRRTANEATDASQLPISHDTRSSTRGNEIDAAHLPTGHDPILNSGSSCCKSAKGRSWLIMPSSSSDNVWRDKIKGRNSKEENNNRNKINLPKSKPGGTGDCYSSEDYFKFTLKKRLLQHHQEFKEPRNVGDDWTCSTSPHRNVVTPPLLALDRDIRAALNNFDDFNNKEIRSGSPSSVQYKTRSSSPTTLASLMAAAQQRWRQQSDRFARRIERASCRAKIEHHRQTARGNGQQTNDCLDPFPLPPLLYSDSTTPAHQHSTTLIRIPPLQLSSSSFSSTSSSSSSSMSWISQNKTQDRNQPKPVAFSPLAISVDAGDCQDDDWAPSDPSDTAISNRFYPDQNFRDGSKMNAQTCAGSPFRNSEEAVRFLKMELATIREKDHQILTQLKKLDAEISRRKSETDALASVPLPSEDDEELEDHFGTDGLNVAPAPHRDSLSSRVVAEHGRRRIQDRHALNGVARRTFADAYSDSLRSNVPPLPECLQVSFKTL